MIESLNSKLSSIERKASLVKDSTVTLSLDNVDRLFNMRIQDIFDCILLVEDEEIELTEEQFIDVVKMYGDKTGYEASNNELRIIDYCESELTQEEQYLIGKSCISDLNNKIPGKLVFYFSYDEEVLTIRFHKFREADGLWTNENVEGYKEPFGYFVADN
jgi:hypothetical protein